MLNDHCLDADRKELAEEVVESALSSWLLKFKLGRLSSRLDELLGEKSHYLSKLSTLLAFRSFRLIQQGG